MQEPPQDRRRALGLAATHCRFCLCKARTLRGQELLVKMRCKAGTMGGPPSLGLSPLNRCRTGLELPGPVFHYPRGPRRHHPLLPYVLPFYWIYRGFR